MLSDRKGCAFWGLAVVRGRYRGAAMRRLGLSVLVLAAPAVLAGSALARPSAQPASCVKSEVRVHDEAVFGHFSTLAAAKRLRRRAAALVFKGIKIENEGCGDFEVEIDGADRQADRASFAAEAAKAGLPVTFEQLAPPMQFSQGEVVGVVGRKRTVADANALMGSLSRTGFLFVDLVRQGNAWLVVMPEVPIKQALSIAHELAQAGFHVQFQSGAK